MLINEILEMDERIFYLKFGKIVCDKRTERGFHQVDLAKELNLSSNYISKLEHGNRFPNLFIMLKIMSFLEITFEEILVTDTKPVKENMNKQKIIGKINAILRLLPLDALETVLDLLRWMKENYKCE